MYSSLLLNTTHTTYTSYIFENAEAQKSSRLFYQANEHKTTLTHETQVRAVYVRTLWVLLEDYSLNHKQIIYVCMFGVVDE